LCFSHVKQSSLCFTNNRSQCDLLSLFEPLWQRVLNLMSNTSHFLGDMIKQIVYHWPKFVERFLNLFRRWENGSENGFLGHWENNSRVSCMAVSGSGNGLPVNRRKWILISPLFLKIGRVKLTGIQRSKGNRSRYWCLWITSARPIWRIRDIGRSANSERIVQFEHVVVSMYPFYFFIFAVNWICKLILAESNRKTSNELLSRFWADFVTTCGNV
jgi:hypothetical protein